MEKKQVNMKRTHYKWKVNKKIKCECLLVQGNLSKQCKNKYNNNWICTLPLGHKGCHVACGTTKHNLKKWKNYRKYYYKSEELK